MPALPSSIHVAVKSKRNKRRSDKTPRSQVRSALRRLFLRSRERAFALRRDGYACSDCLRKQSIAKGKEFKVEVDHIEGIEWERMIDYIFRHLLCDPSKLETVCKADHKRRTEQRRAIG